MYHRAPSGIREELAAPGYLQVFQLPTLVCVLKPVQAFVHKYVFCVILLLSTLFSGSKLTLRVFFSP